MADRGLREGSKKAMRGIKTIRTFRHLSILMFTQVHYEWVGSRYLTSRRNI